MTQHSGQQFGCFEYNSACTYPTVISPSPRSLPRWNEHLCPCENLRRNFYGSFIYDHQNLWRKMSFSWGKDVHTNNSISRTILKNKEEKITIFPVTWMSLNALCWVTGASLSEQFFYMMFWKGQWLLGLGNEKGTDYCCGLNVCVPPKSMCWNLTSEAVVLGGRDFGVIRSWGWSHHGCACKRGQRLCCISETSADQCWM